MATPRRLNNKIGARQVPLLAGIVQNVLGRVLSLLGLRSWGNMISTMPAELESENTNSLASLTVEKQPATAIFSDDTDIESGNPSPNVEMPSKKSVTFKNTVKVVLVATREEYIAQGLRTELWREEAEHHNSRAEVVKEFKDFMVKHPNGNIKTFMQSIGQNETPEIIPSPTDDSAPRMNY